MLKVTLNTYYISWKCFTHKNKQFYDKFFFYHIYVIPIKMRNDTCNIFPCYEVILIWLPDATHKKLHLHQHKYLVKLHTIISLILHLYFMLLDQRCFIPLFSTSSLVSTSLLSLWTYIDSSRGLPPPSSIPSSFAAEFMVSNFEIFNLETHEGASEVSLKYRAEDFSEKNIEKNSSYFVLYGWVKAIRPLEMIKEYVRVLISSIMIRWNSSSLLRVEY